MNALDGKLVVVPAAPLDDLLELVRAYVDKRSNDPVTDALVAAAAQVRSAAILEP